MWSFSPPSKMDLFFFTDLFRPWNLLEYCLGDAKWRSLNQRRRPCVLENQGNYSLFLKKSTVGYFL
jgi:hypothetical protein